MLALRGGFWLRPLVLLAGGVALGFALVELDEWLVATDRTGWLWREATPGGARELLSTAAGALATTLAISLSLTMVTVQLASSQYTPRLLQRFLQERFTQGVVGAFLAAIAFAFVALRAIRSPEDGEAFVPLVSLGVGSVVTLACFALLVVFLHRTLRAMQASTIVAVIGKDTCKRIRQQRRELAPAPARPAGPRARVPSRGPGYVQAIDDDAVRAALGPLAGVTLVWREAGPGSFVLPGEALVTVHGVASLPDDAADAIRDAFVIGSQRTPESDVGFGVRQLVDMGLKALSPGIIDVTTAVMVVNELGVLAHELCEHGVPDGPWRVLDGDGPPYAVRVLDLDTYLDLAFGEIVAAAGDHPRVHRRILELLDALEAQHGGATSRILERHAQRIGVELSRHAA